MTGQSDVRPPSFVEDCLEGRRRPEELEDFIAEWTAAKDPRLLWQGLGLAWAVYQERQGDRSVISQIVRRVREARAAGGYPPRAPGEPLLDLDRISADTIWFWHDGPLLYEGLDFEGRRWMLLQVDTLKIGPELADRWLVASLSDAVYQRLAANALPFADAFRAAEEAYQLDRTAIGSRRLGQRRIAAAEIPDDHLPESGLTWEGTEAD